MTEAQHLAAMRLADERPLSSGDVRNLEPALAPAPMLPSASPPQPPQPPLPLPHQSSPYGMPSISPSAQVHSLACAPCGLFAPSTSSGSHSSPYIAPQPQPQPQPPPLHCLLPAMPAPHAAPHTAPGWRWRSHSEESMSSEEAHDAVVSQRAPSTPPQAAPSTPSGMAFEPTTLPSRPPGGETHGCGMGQKLTSHTWGSAVGLPFAQPAYSSLLPVPTSPPGLVTPNSLISPGSSMLPSAVPSAISSALPSERPSERPSPALLPLPTGASPAQFGPLPPAFIPASAPASSTPVFGPFVPLSAHASPALSACESAAASPRVWKLNGAPLQLNAPPAAFVPSDRTSGASSSNDESCGSSDFACAANQRGCLSSSFEARLDAIGAEDLPVGRSSAGREDASLLTRVRSHNTLAIAKQLSVLFSDAPPGCDDEVSAAGTIRGEEALTHAAADPVPLEPIAMPLEPIAMPLEPIAMPIELVMGSKTVDPDLALSDYSTSMLADQLAAVCCSPPCRGKGAGASSPTARW
eukprot:CAMPEP_0115888564 /NCGR_PEP_ID=MMETSP0287-20121206/32370_1 /TAXON_ID=412157 /ORGANISM="Chrysochromulina rotalis, Strain UIO044" /LENGTH=522 /DNA_ID=CAMNT_0003345247 /DNA_START=290 /DNA_END=1858 /DNA_ORIENTATION=-